MMRQKEWAYSLFIFLIIATPIYLFSSEHISAGNHVTGFTTEEGNINHDSFRYSIYPHFAVRMKNNLSAYDKIKLGSAKLVKEALECEIRSELERCITQNMDRKHWSTSCLKDEEKIFADFAEKYLLCEASEDNYCYCQIPLEKGEYDFSVGKSLISSGERKTRTHLSAKADIKSNGVLVSADKEPFHIVSKKGIISNTRSLVIGEEEIVYDKTMIIYKNKDSMVFVPKRTIDAPDCVLPNKRKYVFCADYGEEVHTGKDQKLVYKFALDFADDTIPKQTEFKVSEQSGEIVVEITQSTEPDIDHYNVYCQEDAFTDLKDLAPTTRVKDTRTQLSGYFKEGEYITFSPGKRYYVSVVPVDKSNNHVREVITKSVQIPKKSISPETVS